MGRRSNPLIILRALLILNHVSRRSRKLAMQCQTDPINIHTVSCARRSDWSVYAYTETGARSACAERRGYCKRYGRCGEERFRIAGVWTLKAGVTSRLRISIFRRENSRSNRALPVLVSDSLWTHYVMLSHTYTHKTRADYWLSRSIWCIFDGATL